MSLVPFHISVPVTDLGAARQFYGDILGCKEGRSAERRVDFNFFGHHLVTHVEPGDASHRTTDIESQGVRTPCRHFGVVLPDEDWELIAKRLEGASADFYLSPQTFHKGLVNEQKVMLVHDRCGNVVEFKANPTHGLFTKIKQ